MIKPCDIADGPGVRVSLFVSGCRHRCPGCFQPETWNFDYGTPYTDETEKDILELLKPTYISGLTILGGEPFEPENMPIVLNLLKLVQKIYSQEKTIWVYSGFTIEELVSRDGESGLLTSEILSHMDILVDGPFIESQKEVGLQFRGSRNQRIIDLKESAKAGEIVLWHGFGFYERPQS